MSTEDYILDVKDIEHVTLCKKIKKIRDIIHGDIDLTIFAKNVIDTKYFHRLKYLRQLGTCHYVYENAAHSRFEHSIGTYHVADKLLKTIVTTTDPKTIDKYLSNILELQDYYLKTYENLIHPLDIYVCELIKIAAMCHDIGHGPFSHIFDDHFIPQTDKKDCENATHEMRSGIILEKIITNNDYLNKIITKNEIQFMKNLINPEKHHAGFIYEIVSNYKTGLDVDKFDYLVRDIYMTDFEAKVNSNRLTDHILVLNNTIVYSEQSVDDIYNLYQTRYRLHKQVYCHKAVISVQFIIIEIMLLLDDILKLSDSILDVDDFCKLTDNYIIEAVKFIDADKLTSKQKINLNEAQKLIEIIETRNLYSEIFHYVSKNKIDLSKIDSYIKDNKNILIYTNKVGFVSGNKPNPFDSIYVYKTKDKTKISSSVEAFKKNKEDITTLMPKSYQEYILTIYYKNKNDLCEINKLKKYFNDIFVMKD